MDVPKVRAYAETLPNVVVADRNLFTCSQDTQEKIKEYIKEYNLNRIVVASCTPRTHEPLFRETLRQGGLNKYTFEMANIRDQCSWVHMHEPENATEKAKDLIRSAVAKARLIQPLADFSVPVNQNGLVIGGGVAGMVSALDLAEQGVKTYLVERDDKLGGQALKLYATYQGDRVQPYVENLIHTVNRHPLIHVYLNTTIRGASGFVGNFTSTLVDTKGKKTQLDHGAIIIATGGKPYIPKEYLYGKDPNVLLSLELDQELMRGSFRLNHTKCAVFIQCVGSRIPERPYCSKACCVHSIQSALTLKTLNPDMDIYILYRDIRTFGEKERLYTEARVKGILFIRYDLEDPPKVDTENARLRVTVTDHVLQTPLQISPDMIILATAVVPNDTGALSKLYKISTTPEGFFLEAHMKLRPVDFATDGMFLAGLCHFPKPIEESIAQARAAAARAATILVKQSIDMEPIVSVVDEDNCNGCGICERVCPYGAIHVIEINGLITARSTPASCKGCGLCAASCPSKAVDMYHFSHHQIRAQICALA
ncbi:MAG: CoB--CoM heterodisulfide reductase iron-sulfur subunit A family protein [Desulfobacterales bacterium]